jgi:hypothetical protein
MQPGRSYDRLPLAAARSAYGEAGSYDLEIRAALAPFLE